MSDSKSVILHRELKKTLDSVQDKKITDLTKTITTLSQEIARLEAKLAYYEAPDMSTLTTSMHNHERKKFRQD